MQIAVDLPDTLYEKLKKIAESDGLTVQQALMSQAAALVERQSLSPVRELVISYDNPRRLPRIQTRTGETLPCGSENLNDYIFSS